MPNENKPKHTPGPWKVGKDKVSVEFTNMVAQEKQANAALIAAAPELLEAVNKALEFIEQRMEAEFHINCSEITDSLYKAIAKAEGH